MRNKRTLTKIKDHPLTTKNNDVNDSQLEIAGNPANYDDIAISGVIDNPGFTPTTSETEQYEVISSYVNVDNSQKDLNVYDTLS